MAVAADPETVLRLCEIARAAEAATEVLENTAQLFDPMDVIWTEICDTDSALRAALGTQPVKETNHG